MAQKVQSQFIETPEIEKRLASCKYGVLSLSDGRSSYGVPLGYCYHEGAVYIGMDIRGRKIDYFKKCPKVCFTVFETFTDPAFPENWWSAILDGTLVHITDPNEIKSAVDILEQRKMFPPGARERFLAAFLNAPEKSNLYKIEVTHFGGKVSRKDVA
jgi:nitroimidazol reductase NimA-like FMN-containing flavoprotein (pyridoxamine 5'-phosphate oxidase superfamily)